MKSKRAFTLTELLVVIAIIASLLAILLPAMEKARLQTRIIVVNAELSNIGLALDAYATEHNGKFPPTRASCDKSVIDHWWALPQELVKGKYMPGGRIGRSNQIIYANVEDKFNKGFAYKYVAAGPLLGYDGASSTQYLKIADGFPDTETKIYNDYGNPATSPVTWVVFSLGPNFNKENIAKDNFPVSKQYWYLPKTKSGIITRLRLKNTSQIGTFQSGR